jgi:carbon storage regulator
MLVLSRLRQQSIMIGHEIEIKVVEIIGDRVKLGFVAPDAVQILRREIYDKEHGSTGGDPPGTVVPDLPTA